MDKFINIQGDYNAIIHSPNPLIPPIFGKLLAREVFGCFCKLKGPDALTKFMIILHNAIGGQDTDKFPFPFLDRRGKSIQALLTLNKRVSPDGRSGHWGFLFLADTESRVATSSGDPAEAGE
ncbi:Phytochrome D [Raphanus sativus]|nr:Phytochrome D [Raphanus sativus]